MLIIGSSRVLGQTEGIRPLLPSGLNDLQHALPKQTRPLIDAASIEHFLKQIDGAPPDWEAVHGNGSHDDRLFTLNRERDRLRDGRIETDERITFLWDGELSDYDPSVGGFRLAIGPRMITTSWGLVRFKPESLPSNLVAIPSPQILSALLADTVRGRKVEIIIAMTGRLVPEESIIYDFAHEEPGKGMVMPVIRIERLDYLVKYGLQAWGGSKSPH